MKRALLAIALAGCDGFQPCDPSEGFCDQLSSYGLFDNIAAQTPASGVVPYAIATPLFSDYAVKERFVRLPDDQTMTWDGRDAFGAPDGTLLVKTFSYPRDRRDPAAGRRLLETRLLVREGGAWTGASYVYDADDPSDAKLAVAGATLETRWTHDDGSERTNAYSVPDKNQCKNCHAEHGDGSQSLGMKARHVANLGELVDGGLVTDAPPREEWPRAIVASDPASGSVEERARRWLDINCGHCHNERGAARTSGLFLDAGVMDPAQLGVCKPPVAAGAGSGGRRFAIVPGAPDESFLVYRIESMEPDIAMPELGRNLVDAEGVTLIREWIAQLAGSCASP